MPRDVAAFEPPPLPYHPAVAPLCGRRALSFAVHGSPGRLRLAPPPAIPATEAPTVDDPPPLRLRFRAGAAAGAILVPGAPVAAILRAVDPAPRGPHAPATVALLLEYALADALAAVEAACGLPVELISAREEPPALPDPGVDPDVAVGLELRLGDAAFTAILSAPPPLFGLLRRLVPAVLPPDPPVPAPPALLCVRIGTARLPGSVVRSLLPGDAVIPDQLLAPARALLVVGERLAARARLDGTRLSLDNPPAPITADWGDWVVGNGDAGGDAGTGAIAPADAGFDELQVTLVFELGRRTLPMREVVALGAGHVIELGPVEGAGVSVLANGARLGRGELVRVGDALGVRLTQIAAAPR